MARDSSDDRRSEATERASMWLERLERTLRPGESAQLREWLQVQLHREAIVERCRLWHGPEILAVLDKLIPGDVAAAEAPVKPRRYPKVLAAVGCLSLVTIFTLALLETAPWSEGSTSAPASLRFEEIYRTPVGGQGAIKLPDGSAITLNTASRAIVSYGLHLREVNLTRGEATFEVAPDPGRLFRVRSGPRLFETGGAIFNMRRLSNDTSQLSVLDGEVKVLDARSNSPPSPAQRRAPPSYGEAILHAMEDGIIGPGWQSLGKLSTADVQARLAWQQGMIIFSNEPLEDAVAEVARYTTREFVFANPDLRTVRLDAEIRTGDVDGVLRLLRDRLQIDSHVDAQGRVVLFAGNAR